MPYINGDAILPNPRNPEVMCESEVIWVWAGCKGGEWANGGSGERANGRMGEWANGRMGEWACGRARGGGDVGFSEPSALEGSRFAGWQICWFAATERLPGRQAAPENVLAPGRHTCYVEVRTWWNGRWRQI